MLSERIDACESLIFGYAGETFNLNSTRQLGVFLFETLRPAARQKDEEAAIPRMPRYWKSSATGILPCRPSWTTACSQS